MESTSRSWRCTRSSTKNTDLSVKKHGETNIKKHAFRELANGRAVLLRPLLQSIEYFSTNETSCSDYCRDSFQHDSSGNAGTIKGRIWARHLAFQNSIVKIGVLGWNRRGVPVQFRLLCVFCLQRSCRDTSCWKRARCLLVSSVASFGTVHNFWMTTFKLV
jgi:hypothetical protein